MTGSRRRLERARRALPAGTVVLAIALATAAGLVTLLALLFGTPWGLSLPLRQAVLLCSALPLLYSVLRGDRSRIPPATLLPLGLLAFLAAFLVGTGGCHQTAGTGWGLEYRWASNVLYYGPPGARNGYACVAVPNRALALVGYVAIVASAVWARAGGWWPTERPW